MPISDIEQAEAQYNARDVLGMCRVWPHLAAALEQTDTVQVYEADEQMAELALQMSRIGLPVNSERRAEIGARLRALRDAAIEKMRPYTEGDSRDLFLDWVASFFAAKARKGEPTTGAIRIGPTRAAAELEEARTGLAEWKAYRKKVLETGEEDPNEAVELLEEADAQIAEFMEQVKLAKYQVAAAQYDTDVYDGLPHTAESAFEIRHAIRRAQAVLALEKKGVNFGAKVQQCAILRAAGVPLHKTTEKSGLPKIDKEVLESVARHPAAKALLQYILTEKTINVYIEGEKRAGKGGGKSKPVMVTEDGYIHPIWTVHKITGRWGSSPNCFDGDTELYTCEIRPDGESVLFAWRKLSEIYRELQTLGGRQFSVEQYEPDTGAVSFVKPTHDVFRRDYIGGMVRFKHRDLDLLVTDDHRLFMCRGLAGRPNRQGLFHIRPSVDWRDPPARQMLQAVGAGQINMTERETHLFLAFTSRFDGLGPALVDPHDVEVMRMEYAGPVYCLSVPSGFVVVRRNEKICVSGQCQNWSVRAGGGAENLRAMIEAPDGYVMISADQAQLEARLIAAMSGCKYMLDTFRRGEDIHGAFAAVGFPNDWPRFHGAFLDHKKAMPKGEKCKCADCLNRGKMRDVTKRLEYGAFYGGKEQTLFESIVKDFPESTLGQVRDFLMRFNQMLPEVLKWRQRTLDEAIRDGQIRSPILGRRQVFPLGRVDPNVAYNYKAQSGGADIWAIGAVKFMQLWDQAAFDARLIQNGHDSVLILCREELAAQVEQDVYACWNMEWNGVPFEMEAKIVKRWSGE
jgi:hypothetical protein